ncbi:hypothetical protein D3C76_1378410 [compost metagenome]
MPTIATPLSTARAKVAKVRMPGLRKPMARQINSKVPAPNTQRQNTTSSTGCPDTSTNQPMVPEINIAATISNDPRRIELSITHLLDDGQIMARVPGPVPVDKTG